MAEKKSTKKTTPRVMDVSKPGKSAPAATSKPVIVGHKPLVQDPMVNEKKPTVTDESEEHKITVSRTGPKVLAPLGASEKAAAEETPDVPAEPSDEEATKLGEVASAPTVEAPAEPETPEPETPAEETPAEAPATTETEETAPASEEEKPTEEAPAEETPGGEPSGEDAAVVGAVADQVGGKKKDNGPSEEEKKKLEEQEKLIADKKYFVSTGQVTKRRRTRGVLILLVLLLIAIGGYVAADAATEIKLPYEIFKSESTDSVTPSASDTNTASDMPAETTDKPATQQPTTPSANDRSKDTEREADIKALHGQLEAYYAKNGKYPAFAQMNDPAFRQANLGGIDNGAFKDPDGTSDTLVAAPLKGAYAYQVMPAACGEKGEAPCTAYTLTATYNSGKTYEKKNLN